MYKRCEDGALMDPNKIKQANIEDLNEKETFVRCIEDAPALAQHNWDLVMSIMKEFRKKMLWKQEPQLDCNKVAKLLETPAEKNKRLYFAIIVVLNGHDAPESPHDRNFDWANYLRDFPNNFPKLNEESRGLNRLMLETDLRL